MSITAALGGLFDKVTGIGGELAEVQAAIRDCKPQYPPEVDEKIRWAEKIVRDIDHDRAFRSDAIGFEEAQVNQKLYNEAAPIVRAKEQAEKDADEKRKRLHERKQEIEQALHHWRTRKAYLQGDYKAADEVGHDAKCHKIENDLKHIRYTLDRDHKALLVDFAEFDTQITALQEQKAKADGLDIIAIELQIREVEMNRTHFMINIYPRFKKDFEGREERIKDLERQLTDMINGYAGALAQCDDELIRLIGRAD